VNGLVAYQYAEALGALFIGIEHRFWGLSVPGDLSYADVLHWPTSALMSLTLDNVIMDSVELVNWVKSTVPGASNSKVITVSGSYGGFLSTQQRIHHPDVFYGAIASSTPVNGLISDPTDPLATSAGNWVRLHTGHKCLSLMNLRLREAKCTLITLQMHLPKLRTPLYTYGNEWPSDNSLA
jgi:hypothetical protein